MTAAERQAEVRRVARAMKRALVKINERMFASVLRPTPQVRAMIAARGKVPQPAPSAWRRTAKRDERASLPRHTVVRLRGRDEAEQFRVVERVVEPVGKPGLHRVSYVVEPAARLRGRLVWGVYQSDIVPAADVVVERMARVLAPFRTVAPCVEA
jgi:hypothetical protein